MNLSRRDLLKTGAMASAALITNDAVAETTQPAKSTQPIRIGVSTYSYWHFDKVKYPIEKVIEKRPARLRRRRDSAPPDGGRREEVSEQPEADGLRQRP